MPTGGHPSDKPGDEPLSEAGNREYALRSLAALGRLPAVSYYEHRGADYVKSACGQAGLVVRVDRWGNVLATRPGADTDAPGLAFVAHLDHPGFEAVSYDGGYLLCRALGGVPPGALRSGTAVQLITDDDPGGTSPFRRIRGSVIAGVPVSEDAHDTPTRDRAVLVDAEERVENLPCAVVFDLPDFDLDGSMIRMRALDDLAGCAAVLALLSASTEFETPGAVHGLFTRAEEVGLVGARLAAADGLLPKSTIVISVESSRTLPGAEIGRGPVIRVGDARTTFDADAEAYLATARDRLASAGEFRSQRQLMSGGVCEATAFSAFGYRTTGMAFPLANYHNGSPGGSVAAESIALADFAGGVSLLAEAARLAGTSPRTRTSALAEQRPTAEAGRLIGDQSPGG